MAGLTQTYATQVLAGFVAPPEAASTAEKIVEDCKSAQHFVIGLSDADVVDFFAAYANCNVHDLPYPVLSLSVRTTNLQRAFVLVSRESDAECSAVMFFHDDTKGLWFLNGIAAAWKIRAWCGPVDNDAIHTYALPGYEDLGSVETEECRRNSMYILRHVFALLGALSCTNVRAETYHPAPPARVNEKRAREGKPPLFETKTLTIHVNPRTPTAHLNSGGGHASPRQHLRRGHIRRLPSGQNTWVQPCVVGDASKGFVSKTYRVVA